MYLLKVSILLTLFVYIYTLEIEVVENYLMCITCEENEGIRVTQALWHYNKWELADSFLPNILHTSYFWGTFLGKCTWDVTDIFKRRCGLDYKCSIKPSRKLFGDCGYNMVLSVTYECVKSLETNYKIEQQLHSLRVRSDGSYCDNRKKRQSSYSIKSVLDMANMLEANPILETRQPENMGAITSITERHFPQQDGTVVDLVYVLRARISRETIQRREPFPSGVDARMRELNYIPNSVGVVGDDRGHLLASSLGGPSDQLNIVPQYSELNRVVTRGASSWWYQIEKGIRQKIEDYPNCEIEWICIVDYANIQQGNLRPTSFGINYRVHYEDGTSTTWSLGVGFSNEPGLQCELQLPIPHSLCE